MIARRFMMHWVAMLAVPALPAIAVHGQSLPKEDLQRRADTRRVEAVLNAIRLDKESFRGEKPFEDFVKALDARLSKEGIRLRIDVDALGDRRALVARSPVELPDILLKTPSYRLTADGALTRALGRSKVPVEYRVDGDEIVITIPEKATYVVDHDIRKVVRRFEGIAEPRLAGYDAKRPSPLPATERVVALLDAMISPDLLPMNWPKSAEVLNGTILRVRASARTHADIAALLAAVDKMSDMRVELKAELFEVDADLHKQLRQRKPLTKEYWEEAQNRLLDGKPEPKGAVIDVRLDPKRRLSTNELHLESARAETLLSLFKVTTFLSGDQRFLVRDPVRKAILEGVEFRVAATVTSDRRFVRLDLNERNTAIDQIEKRDWTDEKGNKITLESPLLKESTQSQAILIADGATVMVPVAFRTPSAQAENRASVLVLTPTIVIPEEQQVEREETLKALAKPLLADFVSNQRLKGLRALYGADEPIALADSPISPWPSELTKDRKKFVPAARSGPRRLALELTDIDVKDPKLVRLALSIRSIGGDAKERPVGAVTIRYIGTLAAGKWSARLADAE